MNEIDSEIKILELHQFAGSKPYIVGSFDEYGRRITDAVELKGHHNACRIEDYEYCESVYDRAVRSRWNWYSRHNIQCKIHGILCFNFKAYFKVRWMAVKFWYFRTFFENKKGYIGKQYGSNNM